MTELFVFGLRAGAGEAYGCVEKRGTIFVNASICNLRYQPIQSPIVIEL